MNARLDRILADTMRVPWLIAIALAPGAGTAEQPAPPIPETVGVVLRAYATPADGPTAEVSSTSLTPEGYLLTGEFDAKGQPRDALCQNSVGTGAPSPEAIESAVNVWRVRYRVLSVTMASITVALEWTRDTATAPGALERAAGDSRTVTLKEGESHTLDVVGSRDSSDRCAKNLRVDVNAVVSEDPRFAGERLSYDLWFVDEAPGRNAESRHVVATGRQGEKVEFSFPSVRWSVPGARFAKGGEAQVAGDVSGSLRGRLRDDGSIDLYLEARRDLGVTSAAEPRRGGIGDGGRKALRVRPEETLGLVLPSATGSNTQSLDGTWGSTTGAPGTTSSGRAEPVPTNGVAVTKEAVSVDFARFFAGHTMSLRLTARRESP